MTPPRGVLLDIEGTAAPLAYVAETLFPYARTRLSAYLDGHWDDPAFAATKDRLAGDFGAADAAAWRAFHCGDEAAARAALAAGLHGLMDADAKKTGLKELQGLIWEAGFRAGELVAEVYPDVPPAPRRWAAAGLDVRIYSSGSIHAQKLFFGHTSAGDLLPLLRGHYDTTTGPKRAAASYAAIADAFGLPAADILFVSDIVPELDAARAAGMRTALALRPGNAPVAAGHGHDEAKDFAGLATAG